MSQTFFNVHYSPSQFLEIARPSLLAQERKANVILPHAEKLQAQERLGKPLAPGQFWITAWSYSSSSSTRRSSPTLEFVLSCTEHHLGTYPLFIVFLRDIFTLSDDWIENNMFQLANQLSSQVDPTRVFSIFGQEKATLALSRHWSAITGAPIVPEPYYEASSSYCTSQTLIKCHGNLPIGHEMRGAHAGDVESIARLCQEFAADSVR